MTICAPSRMCSTTRATTAGPLVVSMPRRLISGANQVPCSGASTVSSAPPCATSTPIVVIFTPRPPSGLQRSCASRDELPRDHLVGAVLAAGEEIAVQQLRSQRLRQPHQLRLVVGAVEEAVVGEPRRNERAGQRPQRSRRRSCARPGRRPRRSFRPRACSASAARPAAPGSGNAGSSQGANQVSSHSPSPPIGGLEAITTRQRWSGSVLRSQPITKRTLRSASCAPSSKPMKSCDRPCHLNSDPGPFQRAEFDQAARPAQRHVGPVVALAAAEDLDQPLLDPARGPHRRGGRCTERSCSVSARPISRSVLPPPAAPP